MIRFFRYFFPLMTFSGVISCQSQAQYPTAATGKSLLWEVSGNGLQKPSYIFGTMHLLCASDAALGENLKKIIGLSDVVYFEIDLDDLSQLMSGMSLSKMKNDTALQDLYTEDEYTRIKDFFIKHNMGLQFGMMGNFQPILISALVYQAILPCSQTDGMEMNIMQEAYKNKKEIKGLETAAFQASLIDNIPYKIQAQELLQSVDSVEESKLESEKMLDLYKDQDLEKLLELTLKTDAITKEVEDAMINRRNLNWADQFLKIAKDQTVLIAVGAGHLGGKQGLLNLLKERGFLLRPIENLALTEEEVLK